MTGGCFEYCTREGCACATFRGEHAALKNWKSSLEALSSFTNENLKFIIRRENEVMGRHLSLSGSKADLVARLIEYVEFEEKQEKEGYSSWDDDWLNNWQSSLETLSRSFSLPICAHTHPSQCQHTHTHEHKHMHMHKQLEKRGVEDDYSM